MNKTERYGKTQVFKSYSSIAAHGFVQQPETWMLELGSLLAQFIQSTWFNTSQSKELAVQQMLQVMLNSHKFLQSHTVINEQQSASCMVNKQKDLKETT